MDHLYRFGILSVLLQAAGAYKNGAPDDACYTMMPQHGVAAQSTPVPYNITVPANYKPDVPFKGILLQKFIATLMFFFMFIIVFYQMEIKSKNWLWST